MNGLLTFDKLIANKNAKVLIQLPGDGDIKATTVIGFINEDFSIGASASYNTPFESAAQEQLSNLGQVGSGLVNKFLGIDLGTLSARTIEGTLKSWTGSSHLEFSINLIFPSLSEGDDVRRSINPLFAAVLPSFKDIGLTKTINAPLGYRPDPTNRTAKNTVSLQIGTWFTLANKLIITSVQPRYSKQPTANGSPLYAEVAISFSSNRVISYQEFKVAMGGV